MSERAPDTAIGHQPDQRHQRIDADGEPLQPVRDGDADHVDHERELAHPVGADRLRERRVRVVMGGQGPHQPVEGRGREQQDRAVRPDRRGIGTTGCGGDE